MADSKDVVVEEAPEVPLTIEQMTEKVQAAYQAVLAGKEALTEAEKTQAEATAARVVKFDQLRELQDALEKAKLSLTNALNGMA